MTSIGVLHGGVMLLASSALTIGSFLLGMEYHQRYHVSPVPAGWVYGLMDLTLDGGETRTCRAVIKADDGLEYLIVVPYSVCEAGNLVQSWSPNGR